MRKRAKNTTLMQQIEKLEKNQRSSATNGVGPLMSRSTSATSEALEAQIKQTVMAEDMLVAGMVIKTNLLCAHFATIKFVEFLLTNRGYPSPQRGVIFCQIPHANENCCHPQKIHTQNIFELTTIPVVLSSQPVIGEA